MQSIVFYTLAALAPLLVAGQDSVSKRDDSDSDGSLYRRRALHAMIVLGDYLYIEGGELSGYVDGNKTGDTDSTAINVTLSIPLGKSWTNSSVTISEIEKEEPLPGNNLGLWRDSTNSTMYRWGGDGYSGDTALGEDVHIWAFEADGDGSGSWSMKQDTFNDIKSAASAGVASCGNIGYNVGGYGSGASDKRLNNTVFNARMPLPGMLEYNMDDNSWTNVSTVAMSPPYGTWNSGQAMCVDGFGNDSIVVALSGDTSSRSSAARVDSTLIDLGNITFYDPGTKKWYWQEAGGDVPKAREEFCAIGVQGDQTYDIYIYGGLDRTTGTRSDIAVLSLPGFQWFSLNVTSPERMRHACALVGQSQMLSLGGLVTEWDWSEADPWAQAIGIFDLNTWEWKSKYDASASAYSTPDTLVDWYNTGAMGDMSWSNEDVKEMFTESSTWPSAQSGGIYSGDDDDGDDDGDSDSGSDSGSSSGSSKTPTGAIAGGVVGGVAGVAIIALLFFLWRRKRKAQGVSAVPTEETDTKDLPPHPGYAVPVMQPAHEMPHDSQIRMELPSPDVKDGSLAKQNSPVELPS